MPLKFIVLLLFATPVCVSQTLTSTQINRVADAGKLYGYVKWFHPYFQYKNLAFDSVFASSMSTILEAKSKGDFEQALDAVLATLHDPSTHVLKLYSSNQPIKPFSYSMTDSILYVDLGNYKMIQDNVSQIALTEAINKAANAKGVVFDLRTAYIPGTVFGDDIDDVLLNSGITKLFTGTKLRAAFRSVQYNGLGSAFPSFSQGRSPTPGSRAYIGQGSRAIPMVFILNQTSLVPELAICLQQTGGAAILQQEGVGDVCGEELRYFIADSVMIRLRTGELVNPNGAIGLVPNQIYKESESAAEVYQKAVGLINNGFSFPVKENQTVLYPNPPQVIDPGTDLYPSLGYRVIAAATVFTVIDHFFPNKELMDDDWNKMYLKSLPNIIQAKDSIEYIKAVAEFYAHINDGHARISLSPYSHILDVIQNGGKHASPIFARVIDGQYVVTIINNDSAAKAAKISIGDVILEINGNNPLRLIEEARKYDAASNKITQTYILSHKLLFGEDGGTTKVKVKNAKGVVKTLALPTSKRFDRTERWRQIANGRNQPTLGFITKDIGYTDLNRLQYAQVDSMFELFKNTKAIIFDMRGYPYSTIVKIAPRLTEKKNVLAAKFTQLVPKTSNANPMGGIRDIERSEVFNQYLPAPGGWTYKGKTVMLMDESTQSQAEHTGLWLKAANNTTFIGSRTSGANGSVINFVIPGNITLPYSSMNVSYPNGETMQRVGLKPDIFVRPTLNGIQEGKDEVLERAVKFLQTGR